MLSMGLRKVLRAGTVIFFGPPVFISAFFRITGSVELKTLVCGVLSGGVRLLTNLTPRA